MKSLKPAMKITKRTKMKRIKLLSLVGLLILYSCSSSEYWKLRFEVPTKAALNLDEFKEIVITKFLVKEETKQFNLNKELTDYFAAELEQKFNGKISSSTASLEKEELFQNEEFWKDLSSDLKEAVFFTGSVGYTEEVRKALLKEGKRKFEDPFPSGKRLVQRKFYTLNIDIYIIEAQSGKTLYKRNFKETKSYKNPNQTAFFAFFDLMQSVKDKLLRTLFGESRIQERYIIK